MAPSGMTQASNKCVVACMVRTDMAITRTRAPLLQARTRTVHCAPTRTPTQRTGSSTRLGWRWPRTSVCCTRRTASVKEQESLKHDLDAAARVVSSDDIDIEDVDLSLPSGAVASTIRPGQTAVAPASS